MKTTDDQISVNTARWFEPNTGTFFVFSFFSSLLRQAGGMVSKPLAFPGLQALLAQRLFDVRGTRDEQHDSLPRVDRRAGNKFCG